MEAGLLLIRDLESGARWAVLGSLGGEATRAVTLWIMVDLEGETGTPVPDRSGRLRLPGGAGRSPRLPRGATETDRGEPGEAPRLAWSEPTRYDVFEPERTYLGQVVIPEGFRVLRTVGDLAWSVAQDELDVPWVRRYRVVRE